MPNESAEIELPDKNATTAAGVRLAAILLPGDRILLEGDIGAGKTHFARAVIQERLRAAGLWEDVPSPTYTLVQSYSDGILDILHADLYRLGSASDADELGLREAGETGVVFIEWPDRLGETIPENALRLRFSAHGKGRKLEMSGPKRLVAAVAST